MQRPDIRSPNNTWNLFVKALTRPVSLSIRTIVPIVILILLIPLYIFIGVLITPGQSLHRPELALDRAIPLQPYWVFAYGSLYAFLILLPIFILRHEEHIRRTAFAYLLVWITSYACFLLYPTVAPRPEKVIGNEFVFWALRFLYSSDPPYNCFPSLHVAHSFVSVFTCYRVHRGVGITAAICAGFMAVSTIYTKQHYVVDVMAGILLASLAYVIFLRNYRGDEISDQERRAVPILTLSIVAILIVLFFCYWIAYEIDARLL
jgi:membrane-associated phospholipid phosphatase